MSLPYYYWYRVLVQDVKGHISTKEGDIPGNNALHAMKAIENMNANTWGGQLYQVGLYEVNMQTGVVSTIPTVLWSRHKGSFRGSEDINIDWNPVDYKTDPVVKVDNKNSHTVSFSPLEIGTVVTFTTKYFSTSIPTGD